MELKLRKIRLFSLIFFLILLNNSFLLIYSSSNWYNAGWSYRKPHLIKQLSGAGINYIINITCYYDVGIDFNRTVYLNRHSNSDFSDVRFVDTEINLLDYWTEKMINNNYAFFWVELSENLSSADVLIYIYYGNPIATSLSSIANTFVREIDGAQPVVLALPMDEGSGTKTYDKSGNGNDGTIHGASWVDGKFGKALSFDGNDFVRIEDSASLDLSGDFTISLWFKRFDSRWHRLLFKAPEGSYQNSNYFMQVTDGNKAQFGAFETTSTNNYVQSVNQVPLDTWCLITGTYVSATKLLSIYLDGVFENSITKADAPVVNANPLFIGKANTFAYGIIDEVRIYTRVLTQDEITDLYNYYGYTTLNLKGEALIGKMIPYPVQTTQFEQLLWESDWNILFEQLLWGSGAWIGFIFLAGISLFISSKAKYSGFLFVPFWLFMALEYFNNVSPDNNVMWLAILSLILMVFCLIITWRGDED